ncbi:hypothetical protein F5Y12DRAFT_549675 [Xylaria sp. FL1777]|nr:hypothetical protein F5Y12DRAFT_549675 [Xylaria sp. FL1777]
MDGPSSRFPSTSVPSATNADPGTSFSAAPRQSLKELFSSVTSIPATGIDPPRPAKEGYEWVWFPAGYWAEREIVETPFKDSTRAFRWGKRSGKSNSGSPKHSPQTATPIAEKMEASSDHSAGGRLLTRTTASSESGGSIFPLNRMPDAPLPSPYLTEEAHVQSLQWPSIDAAARRSSTSGSSIFKSRGALTPSPLHFSRAEDELESDRISPLTVTGASDTADTELLTPSAATGRQAKPKKSFIKWRMFSEQRQRLRRSQASSDENIGVDMTHIQQTSRPQGTTASPLRKASNVSDKSRKSFKGFSSKLLRNARWPRKISNSSAASTSSSLQTSVHSHSSTTPGSERGETGVMMNAWASEYPGGEAIRVQTPRTDQFPRSFFADLSPPSTPHRPLSRQEGQVNLKKTNLSSSFTPGDSSASSTPRLHAAARKEYQNDSNSSVISDNSSKLRTPDIRTPGSRRPKKEHACKEWWEVSVPTSYAAVDQRTFKFDMPEHLPTSPMCPANKRHKSGGTGVCVYHGRAKSRAASAMSDGESPKGGGGEGEGKLKECIDREQEAYDEDGGEGSDTWK